MPGNDRAESEDTSQDEKTRQLGLRGTIILPGSYSGLPLFAPRITPPFPSFFCFLETVLL